MSLRSFDRALKEKLENGFRFKNVVASFPDKALEQWQIENMRRKKEESHEEYGEEPQMGIELPLISFWRIQNDLNLGSVNRGMYRNGITPDLYDMGQASSNTKTTSVLLIPINLIYQIDIWAGRQDILDKLWERLIFFLTKDNTLNVHIDCLNKIQKYSLTIESSDNTSDILNFDKTGDLYRSSVTISVEQAMIYGTDESYLVKEIPIDYVYLNKDN